MLCNFHQHLLWLTKRAYIHDYVGDTWKCNEILRWAFWLSQTVATNFVWNLSFNFNWISTVSKLSETSSPIKRTRHRWAYSVWDGGKKNLWSKPLRNCMESVSLPAFTQSHLKKKHCPKITMFISNVLARSRFSREVSFWKPRLKNNSDFEINTEISSDKAWWSTKKLWKLIQVSHILTPGP